MKFLLCLGLLLGSLSSQAYTVTEPLEEFSTQANIEAAELDSIAQTKLDYKLKKMQSRFCRLKLRPDAVAIAIGVAVIVEWSVDRLCGANFDDVATEFTTVAETTPAIQ